MWVWLRVVVVSVGLLGTLLFLRDLPAFELVMLSGSIAFSYDAVVATLLWRGHLKPAFWVGLPLDVAMLITTPWIIVVSRPAGEASTDLYLIAFPLVISFVARAGPALGVGITILISVLMSIGYLHYEGAESYAVRQMPVRVLFLIVTSLLTGLLVSRIRQQREVAQQLRRQTRRILEAADDTIVAVDSAGVVTAANPAASRMLAQPLDQLVGQRLIDIPGTVGGSPDGLAKAVAQVTSSGEDVLVTGLTLERGDGETRIMDQAISAMREPDGSVLGAVVVLHDMTARAELDRLKDEFVSMVSHDLRTPLTAIDGSLKLALSGRLGQVPDKTAELLKLAGNGTERLSRLVNDLLDLQRLNVGRLELDLAECTVSSIVADAIGAVDGFGREAGVTVESDVDDTSIIADRDRLVQVFVNLLGNAIKFSPSGERVLLTAGRAGEAIHFTIEDGGPGIAPEECEAIFRPFYQAPAGQSLGRAGTGLGLAIAQRIVGLHSGSIWAESDGVHGTRISVDVPVMPLSSSDEHGAASPDAPGAGPAEAKLE